MPSFVVSPTLLFALTVGLGAPRWCQMLWGTSSIGLYLPWAGSAGPYITICLWLWLGVLDSIQGVGLGMMLLQVRSKSNCRESLPAGADSKATDAQPSACRRGAGFGASGTFAFPHHLQLETDPVAQVGSVVTIVARATSPDKGGPGSGASLLEQTFMFVPLTSFTPVFPNFGLWNPSEPLSESPMAHWAFCASPSSCSLRAPR